MDERERGIRITPTDDGSLRIVGPVVLVDGDGNSLLESEEVYLCRCGASNRKPFCDGSHKAIGFHSQIRAEE